MRQRSAIGRWSRVIVTAAALTVLVAAAAVMVARGDNRRDADGGGV